MSADGKSYRLHIANGYIADDLSWLLKKTVENTVCVTYKINYTMMKTHVSYYFCCYLKAEGLFKDIYHYFVISNSWQYMIKDV